MATAEEMMIQRRLLEMRTEPFISHNELVHMFAAMTSSDEEAPSVGDADLYQALCHYYLTCDDTRFNPRTFGAMLCPLLFVYNSNSESKYNSILLRLWTSEWFQTLGGRRAIIDVCTRPLEFVPPQYKVAWDWYNFRQRYVLFLAFIDTLVKSAYSNFYVDSDQKIITIHPLTVQHIQQAVEIDQLSEALQKGMF